MCTSLCLFPVPPEVVNHSLAQNNAACRWLHTSNQLDESHLCQSLFPVWFPLVFPELALFPTRCKMMQNQISRQKNLSLIFPREKTCWHSRLFYHFYDPFHLTGETCSVWDISHRIHSLAAVILSWHLSFFSHDTWIWKGRSIICTDRDERGAVK